MIPLKLSLQNFLSYGDGAQTLDLSGISIACLCGNNGHGKSALLDSITWALWGKARGTGHRDLVHHGRADMWVELDFQAANARYRVIRRYQTTRNSSDLQLQLMGPDGFFSITDSSIRKSQAKINEIIGMDYDTFINSAFLIQGRADEFTNKTAAERKEVLGKIIDLERFAELQNRSGERARERRARGDRLEGKLQLMRSQTAEKTQLEEKLADVGKGLEAATGELKRKNLDAQELRGEILELERRTAEAEDVRRRIPQLQREIAQVRIRSA